MAQALAAIGMNYFVDLFQRTEAKVEVKEVKMPLCPLNHSQRPRLINMRLVEAEKRLHRNFLTALLEKNSPLIRERIVRRKGLMHWFMKGQDNYENQVRVEKTALNGAVIDRLARTRVDEILAETPTSYQYGMATMGNFSAHF